MYFEILGSYFDASDVRIRYFGVMPKVPKTYTSRRWLYYKCRTFLMEFESNLWVPFFQLPACYVTI